MTFAPATDNFRRATLLAYRILSVVMLVVLAIAGLDTLGVFGEGEWPEPFYTLYAVFAFGIVFAWIPAFFFAVAGSVRLRREWKLALPLWLFVAASLAMIVHLWSGAELQSLLTATGWLLAASAVATVWSGWSQRL